MVLCALGRSDLNITKLYTAGDIPKMEIGRILPDHLLFGNPGMLKIDMAFSTLRELRLHLGRFSLLKHHISLVQDRCQH